MSTDRDVPPTPCQQPDADPDMWFSTSLDRQAAAVALCQTCPMRVPCLRAALTEERVGIQHRFGIWGGKTPEERVKMRHLPPLEVV